jgi:taurine dioxygenase
MPPSIHKLTGRVGAVVAGVDLTAPPDPSTITTLRSIVTTPYGGETLIANAAAACCDLPEPLRALADTLRVVGLSSSESADLLQLVGDASHYSSVPAVAA